MTEKARQKHHEYKSGKSPKMSPRERVIRAIRRTGPDRVPTCARFTPTMMKTFNDNVGAGIPEEHLGPFGVPSGFIHDVRPPFLTPDEYFGWELRHVSFRSPSSPPDFSGFHRDLPEGTKINEWGVAYVLGSTYHYTKRVAPLKNMNSLQKLKAFPFPDPMEPEAHKDLDHMVELIHEDGFAAAGFLQQTLFELAWEMRGMDTLLIDFLINIPFAEYLLERITEIRCRMASRYAEAGVDIIRLGDDFGTQQSLIMSPSTFRDLIKPRLARIIDSAKQINPEVIIFFHSDGSITPLIGDFMDIGIDVLNPVQPECIDLQEVKRLYGTELSFWGGIGIQTTMPFGTPSEVRDKVREVIETLGEGGGLFISPTHALQPDVPWENVIAFFEAVDEFGWYMN